MAAKNNDAGRSNTIRRNIKFAHLILTNRRITVRKIQDELDVSNRTVYRLVEAASPIIPMAIENGIITRLT